MDISTQKKSFWSVSRRLISVFRRLAFALLTTSSAWRTLYRHGETLSLAAESGSPIRISWAQDGEDLYLCDVLPDLGFFVDVGAHHPHRFSVTQALYMRGWRGVNVDFTEDFEELFSRFRPEDINVRAIVGLPSERTYYRFSEPALNTIDAKVAERYKSEGWNVNRTETVLARPLNEILVSVGAPKIVQLLCIDVEGADLEVLKTINFSDWEVKNVLIETNCPSWHIEGTRISKFLAQFGFRPHAVFLRSTLFSR